MPQINITSIIVPIIISLALAFIPGLIAGKKGYSRVGFTVYGFFLILPALIHALIIPDVADSTRKQYKGKSLTCSVIATVVFAYAGVIGGLFGFDWIWRFLFAFGDEIIIFFIPFLVIAALLGNKYVYSIIVYYSFIGLHLYNLLRRFAQIFEGRYIKTFTAIILRSLVVSSISIAAIIIGIILTVGYGIQGRKLAPGKGKLIFALPAILQLVSFVVDNIMSRRYFELFDLIITIVIEILMVVGIYALGRFLYEEAKEA